MAKSTKAPTRLYVTAKHEYYDKNDPNAVRPAPLGFLNAYEPGKVAFEKKKITQDEWAYKDYGFNSFKLEQHGPEVWVVGQKYGEWKANQGRTLVPYAEPADPQPQIWDNIPMAGFTVLKSVTRFSTSNKLWRILDPRGIQFEISTDCLETIIDAAGIRRGGEIDAPCFWMSNKNLVAVP